MGAGRAAALPFHSHFLAVNPFREGEKSVSPADVYVAF